MKLSTCIKTILENVLQELEDEIQQPTAVDKDDSYWCCSKFYIDICYNFLEKTVHRFCVTLVNSGVMQNVTLNLFEFGAQ